MGRHILGVYIGIGNLHRVNQTYIVHVYVSLVVSYYCHFERTTCCRCVGKNKVYAYTFPSEALRDSGGCKT